MTNALLPLIRVRKSFATIGLSYIDSHTKFIVRSRAAAITFNDWFPYALLRPFNLRDDIRSKIYANPAQMAIEI